MERDWTPVRKGDIYCSPACGAGCTYEAYEKAVKDAEALAKLCTEKIGGTWVPRVHENLGWHWNVVQVETNIAIDYGGYLAKGTNYSIGFNGGTPVQVSLHPKTFKTVEEAYIAQAAIIQSEADSWNELASAINANKDKLIQ